MKLGEQAGKQGITYLRGFLRQMPDVVRCEGTLLLTDDKGNKLTITFDGVPPEDNSRVRYNGRLIGSYRNAAVY